LTRRLSNFEIGFFFWATGENGAELGRFFICFLQAIVLDSWDLELCVYNVPFFFPAEKLEWNGLIKVAEQGSVRVLGLGRRRWLEKGRRGQWRHI
jgi:hypothetical protein